MTRMYETHDPSIAALKSAPCYFRYGSERVMIDRLTAQAVLVCYQALSKPGAKAAFSDQIKTRAGLWRVVTFSWKHVKMGGAA